MDRILEQLFRNYSWFVFYLWLVQILVMCCYGLWLALAIFNISEGNRLLIVINLLVYVAILFILYMLGGAENVFSSRAK